MRIKRLDGVRAFAAMMVILYQHSFVDLGWTGGELFFVLSGFLLTRILRASRTDGSYWSRFYTKRAVRIVPMMLLILAVNKLATTHLPLIGLAGYALFLGDVVGVMGYASGSVGVLWAVAVGAHFVLLWSVAVRFLGRRSLMAIAVSLLTVEPLLRFFVTPHIHSFETISLTPFHLDSIVAGSLLALMIEDAQLSRYLARWSGWAAAVGALSFLAVSHVFPWFIRSTNTPVYNALAYWALAWIYFFFLAWVLFLREGGFADRALSWAPLLYVAEISYGLFLVHPFIIAILKRVLHLPFGVAGEPANRKIFPLAIVISVAVCALLLRFIQRPIHAWGEKRAHRLKAQHGDPRQSEEEMIRAA